MIQAAGLQPSSVVGYSLGEYVADMVTGSLPLEVGIKLLLRHEKLLEDRSLIPNKGGTAAVQATPEETTRELCCSRLDGDSGCCRIPATGLDASG